MGTDLCFDTTPLIHFEIAGHLDILECLSTAAGSPFAPEAVVAEWNGHDLDPNGSVTGCGWLRTVKADQPADLLIVKDLSARYPIPAGGRAPKHKNKGEMDVVALCSRLGAVALMEDGAGAKQAKDHGVKHLSIVTLLAAAAAYGYLEHKIAWRTHRQIEESRKPFHSILIADRDGQFGFAAAVQAFRKMRASKGEDFGEFLARPFLDPILLKVAREAMNKRL